VAIEVYLFDQPTPYITMLIECKNYSNNVPVDDIEEFSAKVSQVGLHNIIAIFITTHGFQKSALNVAKNRKIGLWRIT
ncbi:restriction endonuclease, partial [Klebsiella pneumoniae]